MGQVSTHLTLFYLVLSGSATSGTKIFYIFWNEECWGETITIVTRLRTMLTKNDIFEVLPEVIHKETISR